jgi:RimJ/RimL family protein N-acetyltransferase
LTDDLIVQSSIPTSEEYLFFRSPANLAEASAPGLDSIYQVTFWRPSLTRVLPAGFPAFPFAVWWMFHHLRIFRYSLLLIHSQGRLLHRSCVFPPYFRFPFMASEDLQIGDTWTAEDHRGKGLAAYALSAITRDFSLRGRRFWYVCGAQNAVSARVAIKLGFQLAGRGGRTKQFGLSLLGCFVITEPLSAKIS